MIRSGSRVLQEQVEEYLQSCGRIYDVGGDGDCGPKSFAAAMYFSGKPLVDHKEVRRLIASCRYPDIPELLLLQSATPGEWWSTKLFEAATNYFEIPSILIDKSSNRRSRVSFFFPLVGGAQEWPINKCAIISVVPGHYRVITTRKQRNIDLKPGWNYVGKYSEHYSQIRTVSQHWRDKNVPEIVDLDPELFCVPNPGLLDFPRKGSGVPCDNIYNNNIEEYTTPRGLKNLGNSCYLNSIIQCWAVLPIQWNTCSCTRKDCAMCCISLVVSSLRKERIVSYRSLVNLLHAIHSTIGLDPSSQHDPSEIYYLLSESDNWPLSQQLKFTRDISCKLCGDSHQIVDESQLTVPIKGINNPKISISSVVEDTDLSDYICSNCSTKGSSTSTLFAVERFPDVLPVMIQLLGYESNILVKYDTPVNIPFELDFRGQISDSPKYILKAFTVHSGPATSGHYKAFISVQNSWHKIDDEKVYSCETIELEGHSHTCYSM